MNGVSLGQAGKMVVMPLSFGDGQTGRLPDPRLTGMEGQPPTVQHAIVGVASQEIDNIHQPRIQLARFPAVRSEALERVETRRGGQAESYVQPFINAQVNGMIREIQQVRPHFNYNTIRPTGQPYNQNDIITLNQTIAPIRADLLAKLPDLNPILANNMSLGDLNDQVQYKTYLANGGKASFIEWSTEKPSDPKYSTLPGDQNIRVAYRSIKDAPNYPQGFRDIQNGTVKKSVNDRGVLEMLRKHESGSWSKVYKDGFDGSGNKVSLHYFLSQSGKVFDL